MPQDGSNAPLITGPTRRRTAPPPTCLCGLLCYDLQPVRTGGQTCPKAGRPGDYCLVPYYDHAGNIVSSELKKDAVVGEAGGVVRSSLPPE